MKEKLEKLFKELIDKYEMDYSGEKLDPEIYDYEIVFAFRLLESLIVQRERFRGFVRHVVEFHLCSSFYK